MLEFESLGEALLDFLYFGAIGNGIVIYWVLVPDYLMAGFGIDELRSARDSAYKKLGEAFKRYF